MDNSEIGNGYKSPMTLGEIARSEETELISEISTVEVKMACVGFARDIVIHSQPTEFSSGDVFEYAKQLFAWITQDD